MRRGDGGSDANRTILCGVMYILAIWHVYTDFDGNGCD